MCEAGGNSIDCSSHRRRLFSVELLRRLPQAFPLQGVVRKFIGLVSPHSGCTQNTIGEQFAGAGALTIYGVTGMILTSVVQCVGTGFFNHE